MKSLMKRIAAVVFFTAGCSLAAQISVRVDPDPVRVGEEAYFVLTSEKEIPSPALPEVRDLQWRPGQSSSYSRKFSLSFSGSSSRSEHTLRCLFVVFREGEYTIPSFQVGRLKTKEIRFRAVKSTLRTSRREPSGRSVSSGESVSIDDAVFAELILPDERKSCYIGEELPLDVNVYVMNGVRCQQLSWPEITFGENGGAVLHNYGKSNPENPNFSEARRYMIRKNGRSYMVCSFRTAFRPIMSGTLKIEGKAGCQIAVPNQRRSRMDDMFDMFEDGFFGSRTVNRILETKPLDLEVRKLPPVPQNAFFSGLTGKWTVDYFLSGGVYRAGEPVTLQIKIRGEGSAEPLQAPKLDLPGFRIYPPEIEKNGSSAEIRYIMIPTESYDGKEENIRFENFLTFNPASGKYETFSFRKRIMIGKGNALLPQNHRHVVESAPEPETDDPAEKVKHQQEDVLYLKKTQDSAEKGIFRSRMISLLLLLFGGLFVIISWIIRRHREAGITDPAFRRRNDAKHYRKKLFAELKQGLPEDLAGKHAGNIAVCLAGAWGLAPGADLSECAVEAEKRSPEFAEMLKKLSDAAWLPSKQGLFDEAFRRRFLKLMGKVFLATLLLCGTFLDAAEKNTLTPWENAMCSYDQEKFKDAEAFFSSVPKDSAHALYNTGNCLYRMGELPQALVCYEQALKLAPRDTDILENLNLVRRKLSLPEKYRIQSPSDALMFCRDALRPDEWQLLFCFGIFLLLTALSIRLLGGSRLCIRILAGAGILIFLVSGIGQIAYFSAHSGERHAIISARNPVVYSLPSANSGKAEFRLRSGEEVTVEEQRMDWIRIRSGSAEGWIPSKDVRQY